jgi:hypothetical protein
LRRGEGNGKGETVAEICEEEREMAPCKGETVAEISKEDRSMFGKGVEAEISKEDRSMFSQGEEAEIGQEYVWQGRRRYRDFQRGQREG